VLIVNIHQRNGVGIPIDFYRSTAIKTWQWSESGNGSDPQRFASIRSDDYVSIETDRCRLHEPDQCWSMPNWCWSTRIDALSRIAADRPESLRILPNGKIWIDAVSIQIILIAIQLKLIHWQFAAPLHLHAVA
jgi:hypothetical protein